MIRWVEAFTHYLMNCDYIHGQRIVVKMAHIRRTHIWMFKSNSHLKSYHIISYHMRSWWIMAGDNWSAKTYSIQFQAKETSNRSNCGSKHSVQWRPNIDEVVIFGAHTSKLLVSSLALSLSLTHLTSPQFNATSTQHNSINHSIRVFTYSLTYWFRSSLINSQTSSFSHSLS